MNITKENTGTLTADLKIEVKPEDYLPKVNETIKKYQRQANMPGFRAGKVPMGVIKKMYGKSALVEEIEKIIQESLSKYIFDNKLDILGSPIPKRNEKNNVFEEGQSFEFLYELGFAPEFEFTLPKNATPFYLAKIDDKMVEDEISDIRRRYGKFSNPETSSETNVLYGDFDELDENGNIKEGGNKTTTTLSLELIKDEKMRKPFIGLKKDELVNFNPMKTFSNHTEVSHMLKLEKNSPAVNSDYRFKINTINQVDKAELSQEFFDKIYGGGNVKSEEEFRAKVREGISKYFEADSDRKLKKDLRNKILSEINIPLPDDFLKRFTKADLEKEISEEEFEHEYYHLTEELRWDLIASKVAVKNNITVAEDEVRQVARVMVREQFAQYGYYQLEEEKLAELSEGHMKDEKMKRRIEKSIFNDKVFLELKKEAKLDMIELPYEEFAKKVAEKTQHELEHHH